MVDIPCHQIGTVSFGEGHRLADGIRPVGRVCVGAEHVVFLDMAGQLLEGVRLAVPSFGQRFGLESLEFARVPEHVVLENSLVSSVELSSIHRSEGAVILLKQRIEAGTDAQSSLRAGMSTARRAPPFWHDGERVHEPHNIRTVMKKKYMQAAKVTRRTP